MTASLANINSSNPVQAQSATGKPQESSEGTAFSQVLASEIAQNRRGSSNQDASARDSAPKPDPVEAQTTEAVKAEDPLDAAVADPAQSAAIPVSAETFLALALNPGLSRPVPTDKEESGSDRPATRRVDVQTGRDAQKGLPSKTLQADPFDPKTAGAQKSGAALSGKANEAAFAGQLSAARQAESIKTGEQPQELLNNAFMRTTPLVSVEAPTAVSGASANHLAPSVGAAAWGQAIGEKIVWMAAGAQQTASLTLNPPNMGPLQIVLNISNEQATASFFSAQPEVRQALEAAFPRLREMMSEAGIQLGQASVSADTPQQNAPDQRSQRTALPFPNLDGTSMGELPLNQSPSPQSGRGLVDTFA